MTLCIDCPAQHVLARRPIRDGLTNDSNVMLGTLFSKGESLQECPRTFAVKVAHRHTALGSPGRQHIGTAGAET